MPSKLCPHSLNASGDLLHYADAGCPLVKLVGFLGVAEELLARRPDLVIIGREYEPYDAAAAARSGAAPEAEAAALIARQGETYRLNPSIKIWEGPNEPVFGGAADPENVRAMAWYAAFEAERLRLLAERGLRGVVGNFATGNPDLGLWPAFLPAVRAAQTHHGYLGLHEYSSPWMWWLTGAYQTANCEDTPGFAGEGDEGWLTLRYRKVYRQFLEPAGLGHVPLVITECGLDSIGAICPGMTSGAWKSHFDYWNGHDGRRDPIDYWHGPERDPERYYAEQLMWFDRELQKDPYVAGATIFTVGNIGSWERFDIAGTRVSAYLVDYIRSQRDVPAPVVEPPPPPPGPAAEPWVEPPPAADFAPGDTVSVPPGPEAPAPAAPALNANSRFEKGQAYIAGPTRELAAPAGWAIAYHDEAAPIPPGQAQPFARPVAALINSYAVAPDDRARLFAQGPYLWKVAGGGALWMRLFQQAGGLTPGQAFRLEAAVLPDVLVDGPPMLRYAADPAAGAARLVADCAGQVFTGGWQDGGALPFGRFTRLTLDFTAQAGEALVALELRLQAGLPLAAWYVAEVALRLA